MAVDRACRCDGRSGAARVKKKIKIRGVMAYYIGRPVLSGVYHLAITTARPIPNLSSTFYIPLNCVFLYTALSSPSIE